MAVGRPQSLWLNMVQALIGPSTSWGVGPIGSRWPGRHLQKQKLLHSAAASAVRASPVCVGRTSWSGSPSLLQTMVAVLLCSLHASSSSPEEYASASQALQVSRCLHKTLRERALFRGFSSESRRCRCVGIGAACVSLVTMAMGCRKQIGCASSFPPFPCDGN